MDKDPKSCFKEFRGELQGQVSDLTILAARTREDDRGERQHFWKEIRKHWHDFAEIDKSQMSRQKFETETRAFFFIFIFIF